MHTRFRNVTFSCMPRPCTVCSHPKRDEINHALLEKVPYRTVAERFEASPAAVFRHRQHLPVGMIDARAAYDAARADDLLCQVEDLRDRAFGVLVKAEEVGDLRAAMGAIREARSCVELLARLAGELVERHAHLHAEVDQAPRYDLSSIPPEDLETVRRIAQRAVLKMGSRR